MDTSVEKQSSPTETGLVIELGSIWIDDSGECLYSIRIASETDVLPYATGVTLKKESFEFISLDARVIISPERFKKIWPVPDVNAGLLAALENIECSDCGHLLKCHADKYGCEFDMGDRHVDDVGDVAAGPCSCTCEEMPDLQAAVEAIRLAKGMKESHCSCGDREHPCVEHPDMGVA